MKSSVASALAGGCITCLLALGWASAADCNGNGIEDTEEIASGHARDCNQNGIPDGCDLRGSFAIAPVEEFSLATGADQAAVEDFDGDGQLDIAGSTNANLTVYLARSGWAVENTIVRSGPGTTHFVAEDFNGDGRPDLAVIIFSEANPELTRIAVFLNRGGALFEPARSTALGAEGSSLAAGDWDRDGEPDLAVTTKGPNDVRVLKSRGNGLFEIIQTLGTGVFDPQSLTPADLDGDGDTDLVYSSPLAGLVLPLRNIGSGFDQPDPGTAGAGASELAAADFDGDGDADVTAIVNGSLEVAYLELRESLSFDGPLLLDAGDGASDLAAADVTGDGSPDLVVGNTVEPSDGPGKFSVLEWNRARGFLDPPESFPTDTPSRVAAADLNGDSRAEVIVSGKFRPWVHVNIGAPAFDFGRKLGRGPDKILAGIYSGDLNGDGALDLAAQNQGYGDNNDPGATQFLWNDGGGSFTNAVALADGSVHGRFRLADFDADGQLDLVADGESQADGSGLLSFFWGDGSGGFARSYETTEREPSLVAAGDLDRDEIPDLVVGGYDGQASQLTVFISRSNRTLARGAPFRVPGYPVSASVGDLNADELPDLVSVSYDGLTVLLQNADGSFTAAGTYPVNLYARNVVLQDLTGDGLPELVTESETGNSVLTFRNRGDGTFEAAIPIGIGAPAFFVAAADLDGNGLADIVAATYEPFVAVLAAEGFESFHVTQQPAGRDAYSVTLGDLTRDGLPDIATAHFNGVSILRNLSAAPEPDVNDNGVLDICESIRYERGDTDATGQIDLSDAVFVVSYLFLGGPKPPCDDAADVNKDLRLDLSDAIYLLGYLFLGNAEPPFPFPGCGMEVDVTSLGCDSFPPCR